MQSRTPSPRPRPHPRSRACPCVSMHRNTIMPIHAKMTSNPKPGPSPHKCLSTRQCANALFVTNLLCFAMIEASKPVSNLYNINMHLNNEISAFNFVQKKIYCQMMIISYLPLLIIVMLSNFLNVKFLIFSSCGPLLLLPPLQKLSPPRVVVAQVRAAAAVVHIKKPL